ncbi:MAG TPA: cobaltochelatase subunit CobN, partial [Stellaceae bacterium]|nr:cobaltochelatase subunit CobN [Stellaceae bacterium]
MHLLATRPGEISGDDTAVDLGQTPAEIVVLSAADSEIACLAAANRHAGGDAPRLRLANLMRLRHNLSVDLYADDVIAQARLVVVRLLGGESYWPYGVRRIAEVAAEQGVPVAFLPGDDKPDRGLAAASTLPADQADLLWRYLIQGGERNAALFLQACAHFLGRAEAPPPPTSLPHAGLYWPGGAETLVDLRRHWMEGRPVVGIVFYRALVQAANLAPVDDLIAALNDAGHNPLPVYVQSLRDPHSVALLGGLLAETGPGCILNATAFAVATPGKTAGTVLDRADCPVIQVAFAGSGETAWREGLRGLDARDLAMNVALPEIDGRLISRAVSFKAPPSREPESQADLTPYRSVPDRIRFVAALAKAWCDLRMTMSAERRVGFVMANYPNKDGRIGNGVGLDTPNGLLTALRAMAGAGYDVGEIPRDGDALMRRLSQGPTNADPSRPASEHLALAAYRRHFEALPETLRQAVLERWGTPEQDRLLDPAHGFRLPLIRFGHVVIGLQPSRGYDIDPASSYHDPDLVPPHGYLAFYFWLRHGFCAHALVHMGKHGTMEWLPGKAVALSETCWPEAVFGPMPHLYPFIVNDPGEGSQAKRRASAVIIDHLTPPLTRAENYGPLAKLEALVDEYFAASGLDPRRRQLIGRDILDLAASSGLDKDCGLNSGMDTEAALTRLDAHLCDLKELQIRDGLHVFGRAPESEQRIDLLLALARAPRGAEPHQASLIRALADDLDLGFDPLAASFSRDWTGPRPAILAGAMPWRTEGDTIERLEALAKRLVSGEAALDLPRTQLVLDWIEKALAPALDNSGAAEIDGLLKGLAGRFVPPGPSGAPSRGRPEVLPTGRNFYSLDTRMVPTAAAWTLGWRSACAIIERHVQDHGDYPRSVALSAWGTANMRTGGDDIAQALALMGVRPVWEPVTARVTGFEIIPVTVLDRPRVDVTLRVSGFFRDAFPNLLALVDSAARAVAALEEPDEMNPMAFKTREETQRLVAAGLDTETAQRRAAARVFGSKPGAYGAGLQAYIDEGGW